MLQNFESTIIIISAIFLFFGIFAFGWLVVHIERGRHFSRFKVLAALSIGAFLIGFGIHFLLLSLGM